MYQNIFVCLLQLGINPLINAISAGRQDLVELLVDHGADMDLASKVSKSE